MMKTLGKKAGFALMGVILALCLCMTLVPLGISSAKAYDGLPSGEFGAVVGETIEAGGKTYVNYQGGYVQYDGTGLTTPLDPTTAEKHVGGKNVSAEGAETTSADILAHILALPQFSLENFDNVGKVYGAGWDQAAADAMIAKFKDKYAALYNAAQPYVCGIPSGKIDQWDNNEIKIDFRYGDGTTGYANDGAGGRERMTTLVYNVLDDEVRVVRDVIWDKYRNEQRRLGAPLIEQGAVTLFGNDAENVINLTEENALRVTAQIYETGAIYIKEDGSAQKLEGMPIKRGENAYEISPVVKDQDVRRKKADKNEYQFIGDVDGTWHPLKTARQTVNDDGTITAYYNFVPGCIEVVYNGDNTQKSAMRYFGYNFDGQNQKTLLPVKTFTYNNEFFFQEATSNQALDFYKNNHPEATKSDLENVFKQGYKAMADQGFVPGYRCSGVKMWDLLVLDFKYGDGTTGFDSTGSGGRERMTTLVYSPVKDAVFGVHSGYFNIFKNDSGIGRKNLGAPMCNVLKNHTFDGKTFEEIQFYEQGYLYKEGSDVKAVVGVTSFDDEFAVSTVIPAPDVPGDYGAKLDVRESEDGRTTYINYRYGAVKAVQNKTNTACLYDYYSGRNFEFSQEHATRDYLELYLLPVEDFLGANGSKLEYKTDNADYIKQFNDVIKPLIVKTYTEYHEKGYFLGFVEGKFGDWNGCDGQQFRWGDSTGNPFNDGRKHMALLAYNKTSGNFASDEMKDEKDELYLVKDAIMDAWASAWVSENGLHEIVGAPIGNPYTVEGCDYIFQDFKTALGTKVNLLVQGTGMGVAWYTDGTTAQQVADGLKGETFPDYPDGDKIPDTDVTVKEEYTEEVEVTKGCGSVAGAAGAASMLLGLAAIAGATLITLRKKKHSN